MKAEFTSEYGHGTIVVTEDSEGIYINLKEWSAEDLLEKHPSKALINIFLGTLTAREERVLRMLYGIDVQWAYSEHAVAREFNITRDHLRKVKFNALQKLDQPSRRRRLDTIRIA